MAAKAERARQIHAMLGRVMDMDPPLRRAFVMDTCANDLTLMKSLLELLEAAEQSESFLEVPALREVAASEQSLPEAVGTYLIEGVLGVGGMATVYEAMQEQPRRRVALKALHQRMTHTDAYVRFLFEAEALARLHHPGIAQIYEVGAAPLEADAPAPFFAMELVPDALTITAYAEQHALPICSRVEMLAAVCDAVHHGHQHGVIHRDLKPGNVLVDGEGRPKVIDFGIARATDGDGSSITSTKSVGQLIGTLNYMSPEQCDPSPDIDIRTDVYSLGVMLYELVCGRLPHALDDLPLPAALHAIIHDPPLPPKLTGVHAHRDLQAIVLKATAKDPRERYDSATALAMDLRHWMNHQPTDARPAGVLDQARLFARRNTAVVAAAAAVIVSVLLVAVVSSVFVVRLSQEVQQRELAELQTISERDAARWQAYTAQIAGALSAMKTGDFHQMQSRLAAATYPKRDWEWRFLSRLSERSVQVTQAHDGMIFDLAPSADGTRLATAGSDGRVHLWDAQHLKRLATFQSVAPAGAVVVRFTSDGQFLVSGDDAGHVHLLHATDLSMSRSISLSSPVRMIAELDEARFAVAMADGSCWIWSPHDQATGLIEFPADQPGAIHGIEASPDGKMLATFNDAGEIWIRSSDLAVVQRLGFPDVVHQVRFSADGRLVGAVGESGRLLVWATADGSLLNDIQVTRGVSTLRSLAFSDDGCMVAAGMVHRGVVVVSLPSGEVLGEFGGHTSAVSGLQFHNDDELLVSSSWDGTIRTWRTSETASPAGIVTLAGHEHYVLQAAFSPDGSLLASASHDGQLVLWSPHLASIVASFRPSTGGFNAVGFSPDGRLVAAGGSDRAVHLWRTSTGEALAPLTGHERWIASLAFDPTRDRVAAGSDDGTVRIWDITSGQQVLLLQGHSARVNSVCFSPDGALIATGSRDKTVRLFDAYTGTERAVLVGHDADVFSVLFSHDSRVLYTGSRDQAVREWDVATGMNVRTLENTGHFVTSLGLNSHGTRLVVGSWFGEVILVDVESFESIASFHAHDAAVRSVAFSPDGRWLATGSYDHTVQLFDAATRREADAAMNNAIAADCATRAKLQHLLEDEERDGPGLLDALRREGHDPDDPWVRNAVLSAISPSRDDEARDQ